MYRPEHYQQNDWQQVLPYLKENSFATLVSSGEPWPVATHIPLLVGDDGPDGRHRLYGHVARANPHWKIFRHNPKVMAIFMNVQSYISASWYQQPDISTWNYQSVHIRGKITFMDDETLWEHLHELMGKYEHWREHAVRIQDLPEDMLQEHFRRIVGFSIEVEQWEAAWKMSQNRDEADRRQVIEQLEKQPSPEGHKTAAAMRQLEQRKGQRP